MYYILLVRQNRWIVPQYLPKEWVLQEGTENVLIFKPDPVFVEEAYTLAGDKVTIGPGDVGILHQTLSFRIDGVDVEMPSSWLLHPNSPIIPDVEKGFVINLDDIAGWLVTIGTQIALYNKRTPFHKGTKVQLLKSRKETKENKA